MREEPYSSIDLYDVLSESLYHHLPMEHQTYSDTYSINPMKKITRYCNTCVGKHALYYHSEGRKEPEPKLVEITGIFQNFLIGRYKCYDPNGEFRCYLSVCVKFADLYCRDSRLEILGRI